MISNNEHFFIEPVRKFEILKQKSANCKLTSVFYFGSLTLYLLFLQLKIEQIKNIIFQNTGIYLVQKFDGLHHVGGIICY